jgi:hypothetical protein
MIHKEEKTMKQLRKCLAVLLAVFMLCTVLPLSAMVSAADTTIYGDVNGDGKVNNRDLGILQQYLNGYDVTIDSDVADVTHDDKVNNRDLGLLQQYLNGWDVTLDPEVPDDDNPFNDTELDWT